MKKIVVMPVLNEDWILEKTLAAASLWADHIIVADQSSIDRTPAICALFPKVVRIVNPSQRFNERERRQMLLDAARSFDGENLIFTLDADEVFTGDLLRPENMHEIAQRIEPGMSGEFEWVNLWRNPLKYRHDGSIWSGNYKHFVYHDDRKMSFGSGAIHLTRVPEIALAKSVRFEMPKVLHYQFVVWQRMLAKQRWYRALERTLDPKKTVLAINNRYFPTKSTKNTITVDVPPIWVSAYREAGIDLEHFSSQSLIWYDVDILRWFVKYSPKFFAALDMWDVDWEKKRCEAKRLGVEGVPAEPIVDPRTYLEKIYHRYGQDIVSLIAGIRHRWF